MNKKGETSTVLIGVIGVIAVIALIVGLSGGKGATGAVVLDQNTVVQGGPVAALQTQVGEITTDLGGIKKQLPTADSFIINGPLGTIALSPWGNPGDSTQFKITDNGVQIHVTANRPDLLVGNFGDAAGAQEIYVPREDSVSGTGASFLVFTSNSQNAIGYHVFHTHTNADYWVITIQGPMRFMGGVPQIDAFAGNSGQVS